MCSYTTEKTAITGSGKGPDGWFQLSHAIVHLDHPHFTPLEHTLNIDFINQAAGPRARVAVELSTDTARELVVRIQAALRAADEPSSVTIGRFVVKEAIGEGATPVGGTRDSNPNVGTRFF